MGTTFVLLDNDVNENGKFRVDLDVDENGNDIFRDQDIIRDIDGLRCTGNSIVSADTVNSCDIIGPSATIRIFRSVDFWCAGSLKSSGQRQVRLKTKFNLGEGDCCMLFR